MPLLPNQEEVNRNERARLERERNRRLARQQKNKPNPPNKYRNWDDTLRGVIDTVRVNNNQIEDNNDRIRELEQQTEQQRARIAEINELYREQSIELQEEIDSNAVTGRTLKVLDELLVRSFEREGEMRETISFLNDSIESLKGENEDCKNYVEIIFQKLQEYAETDENLKQALVEIQNLRIQNETLQQGLVNEKNETEGLNSLVELLKERFTDYAEECDKKLFELQYEITLTKRNYDKIFDEARQSREQLSILQGNNQSYAVTVTSLQAQLQDQERVIEGYVGQIDEITMRNNNLMEQLDTCRKASVEDAISLQKEIDILNDQLQEQTVIAERNKKERDEFEAQYTELQQNCVDTSLELNDQLNKEKQANETLRNEVQELGESVQDSKLQEQNTKRKLQECKEHSKQVSIRLKGKELALSTKYNRDAIDSNNKIKELQKELEDCLAKLAAADSGQVPMSAERCEQDKRKSEELTEKIKLLQEVIDKDVKKAQLLELSTVVDKMSEKLYGRTYEKQKQVDEFYNYDILKKNIDDLFKKMLDNKGGEEITDPATGEDTTVEKLWDDLSKLLKETPEEIEKKVREKERQDKILEPLYVKYQAEFLRMATLKETDLNIPKSNPLRFTKNSTSNTVKFHSFLQKFFTKEGLVLGKKEQNMQAYLTLFTNVNNEDDTRGLEVRMAWVKQMEEQSDLGAQIKPIIKKYKEEIWKLYQNSKKPGRTPGKSNTGGGKSNTGGEKRTTGKLKNRTSPGFKLPTTPPTKPKPKKKAPSAAMQERIRKLQAEKVKKRDDAYKPPERSRVAPDTDLQQKLEGILNSKEAKRKAAEDEDAESLPSVSRFVPRLSTHFLKKKWSK